jgi:hypothetical protein
MRRAVALLFLSLFFVLTPALTASADQTADREREDFLLSSLVGSYQVIGRSPDSAKTYTGRMNIIRKGNKLILEKEINGVKIAGEASVQPATADKVPVIRAAWKQGKIGYGATYLIHTDLDNYPRLTGYIYYSGRKTRAPGLETLFSEEALR